MNHATIDTRMGTAECDWTGLRYRNLPRWFSFYKNYTPFFNFMLIIWNSGSWTSGRPTPRIFAAM